MILGLLLICAGCVSLGFVLGFCAGERFQRNVGAKMLVHFIKEGSLDAGVLRMTEDEVRSAIGTRR